MRMVFNAESAWLQRHRAKQPKDSKDQQADDAIDKEQDVMQASWETPQNKQRRSQSGFDIEMSMSP